MILGYPILEFVLCRKILNTVSYPKFRITLIFTPCFLNALFVFSGHLYRLFDEELSFLNAESACEQIDGTLAVIHGQQDQHQVTSLL